MTDSVPRRSPSNTLAIHKTWFRSSYALPTAIVLTALIVIGFAYAWWPRRAVWAVMIAGGSVSTFEPLIPRESRDTQYHLPEFAQPAWDDSEITIRKWQPLDDRVVAVNLSRTSVAHSWLYHLRPMGNLHILSLHQRQVGPGLSDIGKLANLNDVSVLISDNSTQWESLLLLRNVERLTLVNPQGTLRGFSQLGRHQTLRAIEFIALTPETSGWASLLEQCRGWSNIISISIRSHESLTPGIEALPTCRGLRTLEISAPVKHSDIAALSSMDQLATLIINTNRMAAADYLLLGTLRNLRSLKVYSGGDEKLPVDELRQRLPDCEIESVP